MLWAWLIAGACASAAGVCAARWGRTRSDLAREQRARAAAAAQIAHLARLAEWNTAILQNAMDGFFVLGEDYRFLEVNPAFCRMTGYTAGELLGMRMTDLEVSAPESEDATYWRTGLHHFATAHRHRDGHLIQLESCVIVVRDGEQKRLVGFARDVTERLRAEQTVRRSEAQYRNLVETSRELIWSLDLEGRWTFVNNAARTIYGLDPADLTGRSIMEVVAPECRARTQQIFDELRAGKPRFRFETEHVRSDGETVYLGMSIIPLRDEHGEVVGFTGAATDLTERRQAEDRLREAHARFEALVAGMPLGYIVWSKDFRVLEWNPEASAVFGYTPAEAHGQRATDLIVPAEGSGAFTEMCRGLLSGERCDGSVLLNRHKEGHTLRCEWYNTVLPDPLGGVQAVATLVRDVSERDRLEAQLRQSSKLESLGVLAGGVAHDFNNLLVGIMGNASLAMESLPGDSPIRPLLERVVNAGRRATDLTQRMLAYAGRATCEVTVLDVNSLVEELVDIAGAAIAKNVALVIQTDPAVPHIEADSGQIQQVIMNLLINAAEAIGDRPGSVTVATRLEEIDAERAATEFADQRIRAGRFAVLEVRDTGCGMSPDVLSRMFDPFFSTKFAGRGLGLSALLGIVRSHRGAITVRSHVGEGTVFRVLLPQARSEVRTAAGATTLVPLPVGATVLVIDDEQDIRDVVAAVLESRGAHVLTAEDGKRGIELFKQYRTTVDVVLLDLNMPGMSGEAVCRVLREIDPEVRVLLSTGYSEQEAASYFANVPLAGVVHKPYTATALVEQVGAAVAKGRAARPQSDDLPLAGRDTLGKLPEDANKRPHGRRANVG